MKRWHRFLRPLISALMAGWVSVLCAASPAAPRHVFLFIGDGMGEVQAEAAEAALAETPGARLSFRAFPVRGSQRTSYGKSATDSAAAGTAMACGVRTRNRMLGVTPDGQPVDSIATIAHRAGWKVGILSSVSLDHATPAAFYAHQDQRNDLSKIARQFADAPFEFFGGGGLAGQKSDDPAEDNLQRAIRNGFWIGRTREDLAALPRNRRVFAFNHRLASGAALPNAGDYKPDDIRLSEFTAAAIRHLSGQPFFIMVEGGKIDWACHRRDLNSMILEVREFDAAVREALRFMEANPTNTLIVVTGDHETGSLTRVNPGYAFTSKEHSGVNVPVYATGAGSDAFTGTYDSTDIFVRLARLMNLSHPEKDKPIRADFNRVSAPRWPADLPAGAVSTRPAPAVTAAE